MLVRNFRNLLYYGLFLGTVGCAVAAAVVSSREAAQHLAGAVLACIVSYTGASFLEARHKASRRDPSLGDLRREMAALRRDLDSFFDAQKKD